MLTERLSDSFLRVKGTEHYPIRLVCFHYAGGNAQSFYNLSLKCRNTHELILVELPGRGRRFREALISSFSNLVQILLRDYQTIEPKRTIFYGHSLGALIAYEIAKNSSSISRPERLILSSRSSPVNFPIHYGLPDLDDKSLAHYLRSLNGTDERILENKELMKILLPVIRSDLSLIYNYEHEHDRSFDLDIEVICGINDDYCSYEACLAWEAVTSGQFSLTMIEGGHFSPLEDLSILINHFKSDIVNDAA